MISAARPLSASCRLQLVSPSVQRCAARSFTTARAGHAAGRRAAQTMGAAVAAGGVAWAVYATTLPESLGSIACDQSSGETASSPSFTSRISSLFSGSSSPKPPAPVAATPNAPIRDQMSTYIKDLQQRIVGALEEVDGQKFKQDVWTRKEGGEGISCVLQGGNVIEKAGVGVSIVHGKLPPAGIKQMRANHKDIPWDPASQDHLPFTAAGISLIIHPHNPFAPTVHANYRYFELYAADAIQGVSPPIASWFGGGSDLTPSYLIEEDAVHFHRTVKAACDAHDKSFYPRFKKWADKYFFISHRGEARGIGGVFFDDLSAGEAGKSTEELFAFVKDAGDSFVQSYVPLLAARKDTPFTEEQKRWQQLRRGRYVEFNLVHDRGTRFGLLTPGARIESILMSLPTTARWEYMNEMGANAATEEGKLVEVLRNPREWA